MSSVVVIGAGGHARSLITLLENCGQSIYGIYDDTFLADKEESVNGYKLLGSVNDFRENTPIVLGIGDNRLRSKMSVRFHDMLLKKNLIHPLSAVEKRVSMGMFNQIYALAYVNSSVIIGDNNIINTASVLEHEVKIGNHNHISVNAVICGRSSVGSYCFIGAGATVIDKVSICDNVTIGAGSVVIESILAPGTYVGSPARKLN
jgi:UDP-N-acetylbacillosamine N-acetyltransferase